MNLDLRDTLSHHHCDRGGWDVLGTVVHYTAGGSAAGSARWFQNDASRVSAHYVLSRYGVVYRCVADGRTAYHSGRAEMWIDGEVLSDSRSSANAFTIGVELASRGCLVRSGDSFLYELGGRLHTYRGPDPIEAVLLYDNGVEIEGWWEPYPDDQMDALQQLLLGIAKKHGAGAALNLMGHEEIAMPFATRKRDPGPLFPWERFSRKAPRRTKGLIVT